MRTEQNHSCVASLTRTQSAPLLLGRSLKRLWGGPVRWNGDIRGDFSVARRRRIRSAAAEPASQPASERRLHVCHPADATTCTFSTATVGIPGTISACMAARRDIDARTVHFLSLSLFSSLAGFSSTSFDVCNICHVNSRQFSDFLLGHVDCSLYVCVCFRSVKIKFNCYSLCLQKITDLCGIATFVK